MTKKTRVMWKTLAAILIIPTSLITMWIFPVQTALVLFMSFAVFIFGLAAWTMIDASER